MSVFYRVTIGLIGLLLLLYWTVLEGQVNRFVVIFVIYGIFIEARPVKMRYGALSLGMTVVLPAVVLFGPVAAAWVSVWSSLVGNGILKNRPVDIALFNAGQYALSVITAGYVFTLAGGTIGGFLGENLVASLLFIGTYFIVNSLLVSLAFYLHDRSNSWFSYIRSGLFWDVFSYILGGAFAFLMILSYHEIGLWGTLLVFIPIAGLSYIFSLQMELTETNRELRVLYDFSRRLNRTAFKVDELIEAMSNTLDDVFAYNVFAVYLPDGDEKSLLLASQLADDGFDWSLVLPEKVVLGEDVLGLVAVEGSSRIINDVYSDEKREVLYSLMVVPLIVDEKLFGLSLVGRNDTGAFFANEDLQIFSIISHQAAFAFENTLLYQQTETLAKTDPVTGLYNYRYFTDRLNDEVRRARLNDSRLALLYIDFNDFSEFNNRYGHLVGDRILRSFADIMQESVRGSDIPARYGGDEFVVILPNTSKTKAEQVALRLKTAVASYPFTDDEGNPLIPASISVGMATLPDDALSATELIYLADQNMYSEKTKHKQ